MTRRTRPKMVDAVRKTINNLGKSDVDEALVALLYQYAEAFDTSTDLEYTVNKCGTGFLSALRQMGATPAARAELGNEKKTPAAGGLAALRLAHSSGE